MPSQMQPAVLPRTTIASAATAYVGIPISSDDLLSIHVAWFDATSSATITMQTSNYDSEDAPVDTDESASGSEHLWAAETGVVITGPAATAAGCSMLHLGNFGAYRARLKIVAAADTDIEILARRKSA